MNIINKESEYALLILDYLAKFSNDKIIGSKEISSGLCISPNITLKLLRTLTSKKILKSFRGKEGGYMLVKKNINYYEIIELIQGKIFKKKTKDNENKILLSLYEFNQSYIKKLKSAKIGSNL
ncbi:putative transcriptional regulator (plasmid) [Fusobacterium varium]|nr:putative transcriptional regulator [Fusobacterium varium]